jgi:hypothetical protein
MPPPAVTLRLAERVAAFRHQNLPPEVVGPAHRRGAGQSGQCGAAHLDHARAEVVCYEPSWHHGNAMVTWPIAPSGAAR